MYRNYFGLSSLPFKTTPDPEFFYQKGSRQDTLNALYYAIGRGDAILKVVGEVGCGKTMLLRLLASKLSVENTCYTLIYINSPNLSSKDILLYIASELGLLVADSAQKFVILNLIKMHILSIYAAGGRVVMLVDEAQTMTLDGLEEIRLLSNFETDEDKLLQIVLFGQPELDVALENAHIRQLKSRISYSLYIPAFTVAEVQAYLNFRLRKAHYAGLDLFNLSVSRRIFKLTHGLPRDINILADKLLMAAYGANDTVVKHSHFKSVSDASISKRFVIGISAAFLILLLTVTFFSLKHFLIINHQAWWIR
ncbi:ExeA family protein [Thiomicrorhabdus aquaedulcis]|uniref:ExeA family protein n=1 Tax=Thiomicrorhabdus aquaedulcis TaxID=2211106 RepID=UPI000FD77E13|nr:AAA family ATPase [Thiomicrorhabdus aquaedulcis]